MKSFQDYKISVVGTIAVLFLSGCEKAFQANTEFSPGFSEKAFGSISVGDTTNSVYGKIGQPLDGDLTWIDGVRVNFPEKLPNLSMSFVIKQAANPAVEIILHFARPGTTASDNYNAREISIRNNRVSDIRSFRYID